MIRYRNSIEILSKRLRNAFTLRSNKLKDLFDAVSKEDVNKLMELFHQKKCSRNIYKSEDRKGNPVVHVAILESKLKALKLLLQYFPALANKKNSKTEQYPIHVAIIKEDFKTINILARHNANLNVFWKYFTPLMLAVKFDNIECIKTLLEHNADPQIINSKGLKALDYSCSNEAVFVLKKFQYEKTQNRILKQKSKKSEEEDRSQFTERYSLEKKLGQGSYGKAYLADCEGLQCVLKIMDTTNIDQINKLIQEGLILSMFRKCDKIVKFYDFFIKPAKEFSDFRNFSKQLLKKNKRKTVCYVSIAMEYAKYGDLYTCVCDRIKGVKQAKSRYSGTGNLSLESAETKTLSCPEMDPEWFSERDTLKIVYQICEALRDIHEKNFIHRDLKPENILLDGEGRIVLADFGISKSLGQKHDLPSTVIGSKCYMANEVYSRKPYTQAVDIFSLGCVVYFLATFKHPSFDMKDPQKDVLFNAREFFTPFIYRLVHHTWNKDPRKRPSAKDILHWIETGDIPMIRIQKESFCKKLCDIYDKKVKRNDNEFCGKKKLKVRHSYKLLRRVIDGGDMFEAIHRLSREKFIVKVVECSEFSELNECLRDVATTARFGDLEAVVDVRGVFIDKAKNDFLRVCIVMEHFRGENLRRVIENGFRMDEKAITEIVSSLASSLEVIHAENVIHRGLTIDAIYKEGGKVLLGGFGSTKNTHSAGKTNTRTNLAQLPPEMGCFSTAPSLDIYSLGVVLVQLMASDTNPDLQRLGRFDGKYSRRTINLAREMLSIEPSERPSAGEILHRIA